MVIRTLLAFAVVATAFLAWGSVSPQAAFPSSLRLSELSESLQLEAHHQPQEDESQVKEFKGKILKSGGRFVLEESSNGGHYGTYLLDDQATAKKYEGQRVARNDNPSEWIQNPEPTMSNGR
jgi:hypothetical protein